MTPVAARCCTAGEQGVALVLALVLVTALGFIGLAALEVADESFRENRVAQTVRADLYAANGGLDALVNAMRTDWAWGRGGPPCSGLSLVADDGSLVVVSCTPVSGSGAPIVGGLGTRADRVVDLDATINGARVAHERADFVDVGGGAPGAVVRVRNWTVSR